MPLTKQDLKEALKDIPTRDEVRVIIKQEVSKAVSQEIEARELVTLNDLSDLATKEDLEQLATKDELKDMETHLKDYLHTAMDTIIEAMDTMSADHLKKHHQSSLPIAN